MSDAARPHHFHIPVMGTGFTLDTPIRVARYGIDSVISLVDDDLVERLREKLCGSRHEAYEPICTKDADFRARRITAYLNLVDIIVAQQFQELRGSAFAEGSELSRYFEMLPPSPLKEAYARMHASVEVDERRRLAAALRSSIRPGSIDVNIMTKLDRDTDARGNPREAGFSDALAALRGYARSTLRSAVVFSAGMNARLYGYLAEFDDFFPDEAGGFRKRVVLKVSSYRSAEIQARFLAKRGVWVSEYRIESGLNCGGHAFPGEGNLLGPVLMEVAERRRELRARLFESYRKALASLGRPCPEEAPAIRVTVQGGIGTEAEDALLRAHYGADGTGWGTPFLLVPEATAVDPETRRRLLEARPQDVQLSPSSPLGVPFWNLMTSTSERARLRRIEEGRPGSACPRGHVAIHQELSEVPLCLASRAYQRQKLGARGPASAAERQDVLAKSCICQDLGGGLRLSYGVVSEDTPAICPGPNLPNFKRIASLEEMVGHIYGRLDLVMSRNRPHVLVREVQLNVEYLKDELERLAAGRSHRSPRDLAKFAQQLQGAIAHYRTIETEVTGESRRTWTRDLDAVESELRRIATPETPPEATGLLRPRAPSGDRLRMTAAAPI